MIRSFKYRLYPNKTQSSKIDYTLEFCRGLYNCALEQRIMYHKEYKKSISYLNQSKEIKGLGKENNIVYSALQQTLIRLDKSYQRFFKGLKKNIKVGFPRFKFKDRYNSFNTISGFKLSNRLYLQNIGNIKIKLHRQLEGNIKQLIIKRSTDKYYAIFVCDQVPSKIWPSAKNQIGLDVGLASFITDNNSNKTENPRWYRKLLSKIQEKQRSLSNKKKGSKRRLKCKLELSRLYEKSSSQRLDFQHKLSHKIITENQVIVVEDLKIQDMQSSASGGLNKSINDAGWRQFIDFLSYKAESAGRIFLKVPPEGTSSTCFQCGNYKKKELHERSHSCEACCFTCDRDHNAAMNILDRGLKEVGLPSSGFLTEDLLEGRRSCIQFGLQELIQLKRL